jgi:hypothetical protein
MQVTVKLRPRMPFLPEAQPLMKAVDPPSKLRQQKLRRPQWKSRSLRASPS